MGYFLERGTTTDLSFRQTKPGIEVSVKPRMAHRVFALATEVVPFVVEVRDGGPGVIVTE
jgi:hypothetical protein